MAEKKKYAGGPKRRSRLSRISQAGRSRGEYLKYGDIPRNQIHEGIATYRGTDYDPEVISKENYSVVVARGEHKAYFRHNNKLYTHDEVNGGSIQEITV